MVKNIYPGDYEYSVEKYIQKTVYLIKNFELI